MKIKNKSVTDWIVVILSLILCVFQLYTAATLPLDLLTQRSIHLGLVLTIGFLVKATQEKNKIGTAIDYFFAIVTAAVNFYILFYGDEVTLRSTHLLPLDYVFGILTIIVILLITYKYVGIWMPLIAAVFIVYSFVGPYLSGIFRFKAISLQRFLSNVYLGTEGIYGSCTGTSATLVFMFILYGEVLLKFGAGQFMIDLAQTVFGRLRGGCCKIAVIASGLFGMLSGSSPANVAATGSFTIPMIKQRGYPATFAGGIVSAAAAGGLLMPPVMGAAAFVIADTLQIPYGEICIRGAVPAALYFMTLFLMADLEAAKRGDTAIAKEDLPKFKEVFAEGWHHLLSIIVLVYLLCGLQWSASKACLWSTIVLVVADYIRKIITKQHISVKDELKQTVEIFVNTAKGMVGVAAACACAGIIIGAFSATGLNLRLSSMLIQIAGGNTLLLLLLTMVGCIILGMGLPPLSVYIVMSIMVAPALVDIGLSPIAAHMFVFYFGSIAPITPPVGIAFYVAAGIAESNPMKTGFVAWKLALAAFIFPFVFAYDNSILLIGSVPMILWSVVTCMIGVFALATAVEGYLYFCGKINWVERAIFLVAAIIVIIPETISTLIGLAVIAAMLFLRLGVNKWKKHSDAKKIDA